MLLNTHQLSVRVYLGVIAMKGYSTLHTPPELEPNHQMQFCFLSRTPSGEDTSAYSNLY